MKALQFDKRILTHLRETLPRKYTTPFLGLSLFYQNLQIKSV